MQQYRNWQPQEPEHHYDMRALVFGVVSFLFCQLPVLSIVTGIIALVYAARAKKRQRCYSHGMVTAGMILGIIGICMGVLSSIYWGFNFLRILWMLSENNRMVPAPSNPEFQRSGNAGGIFPVILSPGNPGRNLLFQRRDRAASQCLPGVHLPGAALRQQTRSRRFLLPVPGRPDLRGM